MKKIFLPTVSIALLASCSMGDCKIKQLEKYSSKTHKICKEAFMDGNTKVMAKCDETLERSVEMAKKRDNHRKMMQMEMKEDGITHSEKSSKAETKKEVKKA